VILAGTLLAAAACQTAPASMPAPGAAVTPLGAAAAAAARDRALAFLVAGQHQDGSWACRSIEGLLDSHYSVESYYAWQVGAHALATMALLAAPPAPERDAALHRAVAWLAATRMPQRGSDWDNDAVWAYLYGVVACTEAAEHARLMPDEHARVAVRGREFLACLLRNETPNGGFAYYDDRPYTRRPKWSTSFCTAAVLPSLLAAERLGWLTSRDSIERGLAYLQRCALPEGAYEYDLNPVPRLTGGEHINRIKGSLGRTQVCNWARRLAGDETLDLAQVRRGLDAFFADHRFLDVARMRPVPHEAYYRNAGYFYHFGHYYAALAVELLPEAEREPLRGLLRAHLVKTQRKDGSFCDFLDQGYLVVADTAFCVLALEAGL
jgi:hypothetical protein